LLAVIIILGLAYLAIIRTTDKHPDLAAIEGMDLVTLKLGLGTKELGIVPTQKAGPKPEIDITPAIEGAPVSEQPCLGYCTLVFRLEPHRAL